MFSVTLRRTLAHRERDGGHVRSFRNSVDVDEFEKDNTGNNNIDYYDQTVVSMLKCVKLVPVRMFVCYSCTAYRMITVGIRVLDTHNA